MLGRYQEPVGPSSTKRTGGVPGTWRAYRIRNDQPHPMVTAVLRVISAADPRSHWRAPSPLILHGEHAAFQRGALGQVRVEKGRTGPPEDSGRLGLAADLYPLTGHGYQAMPRPPGRMSGAAHPQDPGSDGITTSNASDALPRALDGAGRDRAEMGSSPDAGRRPIDLTAGTRSGKVR